MAKIIIVDDLARYGFEEYERMLCQMPHFAKRGEEFRPYIEKLFKHGTILAIDEGGRLMGFMAFYANDQEGKVAYWSSLAVDPSLKGQGWGLRLLNCARAMSAASLSPPKSTMPKMVLATAVLTIVMRTMPIKLQAAAMMIAGPGRIARVPTTVAIALGASVAPLTTVAPRQSSMMTPRIGFAAIAPTTASAFISKVSPPIAFQMQKRC